MKATTRDASGVTVMEIEGRLDAASADDFETACLQAVEGVACRVVVEYISSSGLRVVMVMAKRLHADGGELVLCGAQGLVQETLELAGIPGVLSVCPTLDDALGGT